MFGDRMGRPRRFDRIEGDVMLACSAHVQLTSSSHHGRQGAWT